MVDRRDRDRPPTNLMYPFRRLARPIRTHPSRAINVLSWPSHKLKPIPNVTKFVPLQRKGLPIQEFGGRPPIQPSWWVPYGFRPASRGKQSSSEATIAKLPFTRSSLGQYALIGVCGSSFGLASPQKSVRLVVAQPKLPGRGACRWHFPLSAPSLLAHHRHSPQVTMMSVSTSTGPSPTVDGFLVCFGFINAPSLLALPHPSHSQARRGDGLSGRRRVRSTRHYQLDARSQSRYSQHSRNH